MALQTGQILQNRYRIVRLIGQGGFGAVYRAWDLRLNRPCALKENLDTSPNAQRQFLQEAQILCNLSHPNLPAVTDSFSIPNLGQYLVMDYIEGSDLEQLLQQGVLDIYQIENAIAQICQALSYLHQQRPPIIHRDLKPANIIITPQGKAVLVDFGIAKHYHTQQATTTGAKAFSSGFSPPEQYGLGRTDTRSDLYSLGATLYALLTGRQPPDALALANGSEQLVPAHVYNPAVPSRLSQIVSKAMSLRPADRYQSVNDFYQELIHHRHTTTYLPAPPLPPRVPSRTPLIMGGLGFVSLLFFLIWALSSLGNNRLTNPTPPISLASLATATSNMPTSTIPPVTTPTSDISLEATATNAELFTPVAILPATELPTLSFTATPLPTATLLPTIANSPRPTATRQPSATPSRTPVPTVRPSSTPTPLPTATFLPTATNPPPPTATFPPPPTAVPLPTATFPPPPTNTPWPTNTPPPPPTNTPAPTNTIAFQGNVAPSSNRNPDGPGSGNAFDGNLNSFWVEGLGHRFSLTLSWGDGGYVTRILVWDRPQNSPDNNQINQLTIALGNGMAKTFDMMSGGPRCIDATLSSSQFINSVTLTVADGSGNNGLSEVEIWIGPKTTGLSCSNYGTIP